MAESVVSFVLEKVGEFLIEEAKFLGGVSDQVEKMQTELKRMQCFLKVADKRVDEDEIFRGWVSEIKELAYNVENVIETFAHEIASRREKGFRKKFKRYATIFIEGAIVHKFGKEIEAINDKFTDLRKSVKFYGTIQFKEGESSRKQHLRQSYSHIVEDHTVGLDESAKILVPKLLAKEREFGPNIISLQGMGGLGKTTLANKLYYHTEVRQYFDGFAWACVSQQFQARDVLTQILVNVSSSSEKDKILKMKDGEIAEELYQVQQMKKCLVILDDIWRVEDWDALKHGFPIGKVAGMIIFTTRNKDLALHADPNAFRHEPQTLTEEESWELLQKKAFPRRGCPDFIITTDMENLGREMVKKCAGLPLAIVVLGGLLATKLDSFNEWKKVHKNIDLYLSGKGQNQEYSGVHAVLGLSYNELPYHLKPCFLHLGNFPEDYDIPKKKLFRMWVAEGFVPQIQSEVDGTEMDMAESHLDELIGRSMVQVGKVGSTGRVKTCRLHDLMRDLCLSKAKEEKFLEIIRAHNIKDEPISSRAHRFVVYAGYKDLDLGFYAKTPYLQSILFFGTSMSLPSLSNFKLLKVLSFDGCRIGKKMTKEIGCLIHLRYLAFENCIIDHLPSSIGNLRYLQTFIICSTFILRSNVRCKFEQLRQLRHLELRNFMHTEGGKLLKLGNMRNLQTLRGFHTGICDPAELVNFSNLEKLEIKLRKEDRMEIIPSVCLNSVTSLCIITTWDERKEEEMEKVLSCCNNLQKLSLRGVIQCDKLREYQHFPRNLTKLTLRNSNLKKDPMTTLEKLPNLVILSLLDYSFVGNLLACSSNGFPRLKTLVLNKLPNLVEWLVDEEAMSRLCHLHISNCQKLKMVPDGIQFITTLHQLEIKGMPRAFEERLQVVAGREGDDLYKVRHVPSIIFKDNDYYKTLQKLVIKLHMDSNKCRTEAMKIAVMASGVESVSIGGGPERDQMTVIGDGVDFISLVKSLRKLVGHAEFISINQ